MIREIPKEFNVPKNLSEFSKINYPFMSNQYYNDLVKKNPELVDVIKPSIEEQNSKFSVDASNEKSNVKLTGLQHKYQQTALIQVADECFGYCRFCFRKRLFLENKKSEKIQNMVKAIEYLKSNSKISCVLLSGGDPLTLNNDMLEWYLEMLTDIKSIKIIRIGTRAPAFYPDRIIKDKKLVDILEKYGKKVTLAIMTHFLHQKELTEKSIDTIRILKNIGMMLNNQNALLKGINDDAKVLSKLYKNLTFNGVQPYYLFQCRPSIGNEKFSVSFCDGYKIFKKLIKDLNGLCKKFRYTISHTDGKLEVLYASKEKILFRFHQAKNPNNTGQVFSVPFKGNEMWLNSYKNAEFWK